MQPATLAAALVALVTVHDAPDAGPDPAIAPAPRLLAASPTTTAASAARQDPEQARELLELAQRRFEQGRYDEVHRMYQHLAEEFPETEAGKLGARRSGENAFLGLERIVDNGPPANRVDIVLMNDGYELDDQDSWDKLASDLPREFERQETFEEYLGYFNLVRCNLKSEDDNVSGYGREESTALGGYVTESRQGHVAVERDQVLAMLGEVPADEHDGLVIAVVRVGAHGTGSQDIACVGSQNVPIMMHEWGHAFGGLGDEYAEETHDRNVANAPNVSTTEDERIVPWAHWIEADARGVGVYEGANGQVRGAWKPTASGCVMQTGEFFCPPCREALVLAIYRYVDPIDDVSTPAHGLDSEEEILLEDDFEVGVQVMQPASHKLDVRWYLLPEDAVPPAPKARMLNVTDRRARGPLPELDAEPIDEGNPGRDGVVAFELKARGLEPGRYRLVARARDTTEFRGERLPWVLKDEHGLLESERGWWIRVPE